MIAIVHRRAQPLVSFLTPSSCDALLKKGMDFAPQGASFQLLPVDTGYRQQLDHRIAEPDFIGLNKLFEG